MSRFNGEVFLSNSALSQITVQETNYFIGNMVKLHDKNGIFKIVVQSKFFSSTFKPDMLYKFYSNGILRQSSVFSPRKLFEIQNIKIPDFKDSSLVPKEDSLKEIDIFEIQFFEDDKNTVFDSFTLTFYLFNQSKHWRKKQFMNEPKNPQIWKDFMEIFNREARFIRELQTGRNEIPIPCQTSLERLSFEQDITQGNRVYRHLFYNQLLEVYIGKRMIKFKTNIRKMMEEFHFEDKYMHEILLKYFTFLSFIHSFKVFDLSIPMISMEVDILQVVDSSLIPCSKESIHQRSEYSIWKTEVEKGRKMKIKVNLKKIFCSASKEPFLLKVFSDDEKVSEHFLGTGENFIDFKIQEKNYSISVELVFYQVDVTKNGKIYEEKEFLSHQFRIHFVEKEIQQEDSMKILKEEIQLESKFNKSQVFDSKEFPPLMLLDIQKTLMLPFKIPEIFQPKRDFSFFSEPLQFNS
jgi:hypothetical protein